MHAIVGAKCHSNPYGNSQLADHFKDLQKSLPPQNTTKQIFNFHCPHPFETPK